MRGYTGKVADSGSVGAVDGAGILAGDVAAAAGNLNAEVGLLRILATDLVAVAVAGVLGNYRNDGSHGRT